MDGSFPRPLKNLPESSGCFPSMQYARVWAATQRQAYKMWVRTTQALCCQYFHLEKPRAHHKQILLASCPVRSDIAFQHHTKRLWSQVLVEHEGGAVQTLLQSTSHFLCPKSAPLTSRKDYSGEYTIYLIPCTVQPTQPWIDPGEKPLACTAHAPER